MPIAQEGVPFLLVFVLAAIAFAVGGLWAGVLPCLLVAGYIAFFFRNPERLAPVGASMVACPADGKVIFVGKATEYDFSKEEMQKISIFMSLWDVHINRFPVDGTVKDMKYRKGRFMAAWEEGASQENERNALLLETNHGDRMVVVQVAGLVARRIICYPTIGSFILKGQRFGLIRFGSRVDVYLPKDAEVLVKMGEKTLGGETILAKLKEKVMPPKNRHQYILILPSLFTTGNLFCGFYSILHSFNHQFDKAAYAILLAGIFDVLDGRVARITKSTSQFGLEYDSIADVVSFGVAPAILTFVWALQPFGRLGWAGAFFFAACGALRLARFNTITSELPKSYFLGLPIPAAANLVAGVVISSHDGAVNYPDGFVLFLVFALGLLMVSSIRYRSFKDFDLRHRRSFILLVFMVAGLALVATRPELTIAMVFGYYVAWGPDRELASFVRRKFFGKADSKVAVDKVVDRE